IAADIENAVAAQEIEIGLVIHVVEIRALGPGIDFVEPDDALGLDQGPVQVLLVQAVVLAQARSDDFLQIEAHIEARNVLDFSGQRKSMDRLLRGAMPKTSRLPRHYRHHLTSYESESKTQGQSSSFVHKPAATGLARM